MASSLSFLPRTLAKGKQKDFQHAPQVPPSTVSSASLKTTTTPGHTNKAKYSDEDYINLFNLALSDYALWADPDLRRSIDWSRAPLSNENTGDGFFSLSRLIRRSEVLSPLNIEHLQIPIAKALRSDATSTLEVRLLVSEPSSSWSGKRDATRDVGAYELRQRDADNASTRPSQSYSRQDWEDRTIYVENIPVQLKTIPAIMRLVNSLISERSLSKARSARVQGIILPRHHQDKAGDAPTFKGFALIVLEDILDVNFLLKRWPWDRRQNVNTDPQAPAEVNEATKFGFRALLKSRWDQLKEEYLSYRERLVSEINAFQDAAEPLPTAHVLKPDSEPADTNHGSSIPVELPKLDNTSPYPFNSLVFVRNVHPETNKTTLRKFFGRALELPLASNELDDEGIDYVDYNKGMDTVRDSLLPFITASDHLSASATSDSPHQNMRASFSTTSSPTQQSTPQA
ncbi:hypothetical protein C0992_003031 [Termitomyces sp. T32_za158]|nr:hypothetical protein C0992_003031 [Termitomyces sp. T32_za158]